MVYLFIKIIYPVSKAEEVAKKYIEVQKKYPPDRTLGKEIIPGAVHTTIDGVSVISIYEVKRGKYEEAFEYLAKILLEYSVIEGYKFEVETRATLVEAMGYLGMKPPE